MSKAEERALVAYPNEHFVDHTYAEMCRGFYEEGYEQAEKDIALTWEDIKTIEQIITTSDWYDFEISDKLWSKEFYEEVLKRFNEAKKNTKTK